MAGKSAHGGPDLRVLGPGGNTHVNNFCMPKARLFFEALLIRNLIAPPHYPMRLTLFSHTHQLLRIV